MMGEERVQYTGPLLVTVKKPRSPILAVTVVGAEVSALGLVVRARRPLCVPTGERRNGKGVHQ